MIHHGDALVILAEMPECLVHAVVTDPPYALGYAAKDWDTSVAFDPDTWRAVLRVTRPGGHLLAFGANRTVHRLMTAVEAAGWEIRDLLAWGHAQGQPHGYGLKPAWEPIVAARRPLTEPTVEDNVERWGTGALDTDGARMNDRFPANVLVTDQSVLDGSGWMFFVPKATRREKEPRLPGRTEARPVGHSTGARKAIERGETTYAGGPGIGLNRISLRRNDHVAVKPVDLMRHLVRLACPPGGIVLDPFVESGTTLIAADAEGRGWIGIEQDARAVDISEDRLAANQLGLGMD